VYHQAITMRKAGELLNLFKAQNAAPAAIMGVFNAQ
jgi:hypothetical protein